MKRSISILLLAVLLFSAFGCTASLAQEKTKLKIYNWHTERVDLYNKQILPRFMEKHPDIEVVYEGKDLGSYDTMLMTAINSGDAPDLIATMGIGTNALANLVDQALVVPLDDAIDFSAYPESILVWGRIGGKNYITPAMLGDGIGIYYNQDLFAKYGLSEPKNYQDVIDCCETLMKNGITPFALPAKDSWTATWFLNEFIAAYIPEWNSGFPKTKKYSDPEFLDALNTFKGFIDKGYFGSANEMLATDGNSVQMLYSAQKVAMVVDGSWASPFFQGLTDVKTGVFIWPTSDGKTYMPGSPATDQGCAIYANTKNMDAAIELAKFLMGREANQILADQGTNIPLNIPGMEPLTTPVEMMEGFSRANMEMSYFDKMSGLVKEGYSPYDNTVLVFQRMIYGELTPEAAAAELDAMMDYSKAA